MRIHYPAIGYSYAAGRGVMAKEVNAPRVPTIRRVALGREANRRDFQKIPGDSIICGLFRNDASAARCQEAGSAEHSLRPRSRKNLPARETFLPGKREWRLKGL